MTLTRVIDNKNTNFNVANYYYYTICIKGSFSNEWDLNRVYTFPINEILAKANSAVITLVFTPRNNSFQLPPEGQVDFQVILYQKS